LRNLVRKSVVLIGLVLVLVGASTACGGASNTAGTGTVSVVAGENFWGSIAAQLGGSKVNVQSVVTDPNADPHEYESSTKDARAFARADLVILNGAGYDDWGQKLLAANSSNHRTVLDVAHLLGKKAGDNPHFWYDPQYVITAANAVTADYKSIDQKDAAYFDQQRATFGTAMEAYFGKIADINAKYRGVAIGATESIFFYMAAALGLNLISPPEFMNAVAEGNDPPASAVVEFQNQLTGRNIKVLVYNNQTETAVTTNMKRLAQPNKIPLVGVSETLQPLTATFQDWQLSQLKQLETALGTKA
jgi:zinc/manganese transport system substrate-binding protein